MWGQPLCWHQHQQKLEVSIAWLALAGCHYSRWGRLPVRRRHDPPVSFTRARTHTLHIVLPLATVWSNNLLQLHECLRLMWFKRGPWGFLMNRGKNEIVMMDVPLESCLLHCTILSSTTVCKFFSGFYWDLM